MIILLIQGGLIALYTMIAFQLGLTNGSKEVASKMAFATLTLARLFHGFNCRRSLSILAIGFKKSYTAFLPLFLV